jgi:hypothetical protein
MKKCFFFCLIAALSWGACKNDASNTRPEPASGSNAEMVHNPATANQPMDTNSLARITFSETEFDFGEANEGDEVVHKFQFTNTGKVPLMILKARSSCGCTVPSYPEEPIPPGGSGEITAKFNTSGKLNQQKKVIHVTANTYPNETSVTLKGFVKPTGE